MIKRSNKEINKSINKSSAAHRVAFLKPHNIFKQYHVWSTNRTETGIQLHHVYLTCLLFDLHIFRRLDLNYLKLLGIKYISAHTWKTLKHQHFLFAANIKNVSVKHFEPIHKWNILEIELGFTLMKPSLSNCTTLNYFWNSNVQALNTHKWNSNVYEVFCECSKDHLFICEVSRLTMQKQWTNKSFKVSFTQAYNNIHFLSAHKLSLRSPGFDKTSYILHRTCIIK